ncbi:MAG: glycosyltransferase family 39 protein [Candidatus Omnitrophica bacterium]|nr:glycosyltransferase family 39 protein [Candidatus Omnitrophota bacterium]
MGNSKIIKNINYGFTPKFGFIAVFICLLGFALRVFKISSQSIWFDEAASFVSAMQTSITAVIKTTIITERIPPLYPLFLHFWIRIFGFSEAAIRFPSVVFGALTVPLLYVFTKKLLNCKVAIIAALLLAISPLHIIFSQEARYICVFVFLNLLSLMLFCEKAKKDAEVSLRNLYAYMFVTCLAMYANYLMIFTILAQNVISFFTWKNDKKKFHAWMKGQLVIGLLCLLPLTFFLINQILRGEELRQNKKIERILTLETPQNAGADDRYNEEDILKASKANVMVKLVRGRIGFKFISTLKYTFFETPYFFGAGAKYLNRVPYGCSPYFLILFMIPSAVLFFILFLYGVLLFVKNRGFAVLALFFIPLICILLIKLFDLRPIGIRHVVFLLPLFHVLIALALCSIKQKKIMFTSVTAVVCYIVLALSINYFDERTYKDNWRYLTDYVSKNLTADDFIIFHGEYAGVPFRYYANLSQSKNEPFMRKNINSKTIKGRDGSLENFFLYSYESITKNKKRIWLISYYAPEEEKDRIKAYLDSKADCIEENMNLGRKLTLVLYKKRGGK